MPRLEPVKVLDRGDHGWAEHIAFAPCREAAEVGRFYQRQGAYLALLYILEATDFHYQNLIAAGEHPMLVDLETLFQPRMEEPAGCSTDLVEHRFSRSVLRVGLLPSRRWYDPAVATLCDPSGLAASDGMMTSTAAVTPKQAGTDEMRFVRQRVPMSDGFHRPRLGQELVQPEEYAEDLLEGFTRTYDRLLERREELLAADGPLASFTSVEVRTIVRPTRVYGLLLEESFHPELLGNALDRDRFFDRLWVEVDERPELAALIAAERRDLWRNDIPRFTARPGSFDLWDSDGHCQRGFFERSGQDMVRERITELSAEDLEWQRHQLRAALATLSAPGRRPRDARHEDTRLRPRLLDFVVNCGDHLLSQARPLENGLGWPSRDPSGRPLSGFSHGAAGIGWALVQLATVTGEPRFERAARQAIAFERSTFSASLGRWPDLRFNDAKASQAATNGSPKLFPAWCHGAAGIGLSRLAFLGRGDDTELDGEIRAAARLTLSQGFGQNHCLCHGDLGNLDALLLMNEALQDRQIQQHCDRLSASILASGQDQVCLRPPAPARCTRASAPTTPATDSTVLVLGASKRCAHANVVATRSARLLVVRGYS